MEALKRLSLAVAVLALAGVGCGDDDGDTGDGTTKMDAGSDASIDSGIKTDAAADSAVADSSVPTFACSSGKLPTADHCGGLHCEQSLAQLTASVSSTGKCKATPELTKFCNLSSIVAVQNCTLMSFTPGAPTVAACSATALPDYSAECLGCFVDAANCAATKCLTECSSDPSGKACDTCRVTKGCISSFYTCTGIDNPIPGM